MTQELDYYEILGVSKNDTAEAIKNQYRILATRFHPDKLKSSLAESLMKKINEAYEVLSDPQKRRLYDENYNNTKEKQEFTNKSKDKTNTEFKASGFKKTSAVWKKQLKTMAKELGKLLTKKVQEYAAQAS